MNDQIHIERMVDHDGRTIRVKRGIIRLTEKQLRNFWKKVSKLNGDNACWIWSASKYSFGYGAFGISTGRATYAHRVSYQLKHGPIDCDICVLHNCPCGEDNPSCVNPAHLWLGTRIDNNKDCIRKGRARHPKFKKTPEQCVRGERVNTAKLTIQQVVEIRENYAKGKVTQQYLADYYGVTQVAISLILRMKNWKIT